MIDVNCLLSYGAMIKTFNKDTFFFNRGNQFEYHFQIFCGLAKFVREDEDGNTITCQILGRGDANYFILADVPSHFDMVAITDCTVLMMPKKDFLSMVISEKGMLRDIMLYVSGLMYSQMEINCKEYCKTPSSRILELFQFLKYEQTDQEILSFVINLSVHEIALVLGISLDICIETLSNMEQNGSVIIRNSKIFF